MTEGTASTPANTTWVTNQASSSQWNHRLVSYTQPGGATPWTKAALDTAQVGVRLSAAGASGGVDVSNVWLTIEYAPPVGGGGDTTPPVVSSLAESAVSSSTAVVSCATDENAIVQVQWATDAGFTSPTTRPYTAVYGTSHSDSLSGLPADTIIHYRFRAKDVAGNESAYSAADTFTTDPAGSVGDWVDTNDATGISFPKPVRAKVTMRSAGIEVDLVEDAGVTLNSYSDTTLEYASAARRCALWLGRLLWISRATSTVPASRDDGGGPVPSWARQL